MNIRNRILIGFGMIRRNRLSSAALLIIVFLCFSMFGRIWTEIAEQKQWETEYQTIQNGETGEWNYLEYTRFPSQETELDNKKTAGMLDQLWALDGVKKLAAYQYNAVEFDELSDPALGYQEFAKSIGSTESEAFLSRAVRAVWMYGDAWEFCRLDTSEGEIPKNSQELPEDHVIPIIAGARLKDFFYLGREFHAAGQRYRVVGILKKGSRFLANDAYGEIRGYVDLDQVILTNAQPEYYSGAYVNFQGNVYFQVQDGVSDFDAEREILTVLEQYQYHGWCESIGGMFKRTGMFWKKQLQNRQFLCVLTVAAAGMAAGIVVLLEIQGKRYGFGVWRLCGVSMQELLWFLGVRYGMPAAGGFAAAMAATGIYAHRSAAAINACHVINDLKEKIFWSSTFAVTGIAEILAVIVLIVLCYLLLRKKTVMQLMAQADD